MNFTSAMKYMILFSLTLAVFSVLAAAQTFSSGSTGSDGALNFSTPGTYTFDPKSYNPSLDPANDGVFNFTTITIASGVTVKLAGNILNGPVVWLAQGAVKIDGAVDLSGQDGFSASNTTQRTYTVPGPGGYAGGYPAIGSNPPGPGSGPNGGVTPTLVCGSNYAQSGGTSANQFLVPLVGGSGGGGIGSNAGGAGGGSILVASSVSITGTGSMNASGGAGLNNAGALSGSGAGGGIRLVAPVVSISGHLNASAGLGFHPCQGGSNGVVRIEAFSIGSINASGSYYTATPFGLFVSPAGTPAVTVISVGGNPVATSPTGTFIVPDVTVNSSTALPFVVQAANVPVGTVVTLVIFSENGPDQTILSPPLAGTLASSTAIANVTLPPGFSKGFVKATF